MGDSKVFTRQKTFDIKVVGLKRLEDPIPQTMKINVTKKKDKIVIVKANKCAAYI